MRGLETCTHGTASKTSRFDRANPWRSTVSLTRTNGLETVNIILPIILRNKQYESYAIALQGLIIKITLYNKHIGIRIHI